MASSDYESRLSQEQKELLTDVQTGKIKEVQDLILKLENLSRDELFDYFILVAALRTGYRAIFEHLIEEVCTVKMTVKTGSHCTPLYYAVEKNDAGIFKELWKKGASLCDKDANPISALELVITKHRTILIRTLLNDIKDPENLRILTPNSQDDIALFHAYCMIGVVEAIQIFMSHNFSLNSRSTFDEKEWKGFTPLHFVVKSSSSGALRALLNHDNIELMAQDERGRTCLNLAFRSSSVNSPVKGTSIELISHSIGQQFINLVDENGLSHFHIFCCLAAQEPIASKCEDFFNHFINNGIDVNDAVSLHDKKYPGCTALHFAVKGSSWEILKLLLRNGADPTKTDKCGRTPLHFLCEKKIDKIEQHIEIAKLLISHGADPVAKDSDDRTPLHRAFCVNYIVRELNDFEQFFLSQNQTETNHADKHGISYLHMACTGDDLSIVKKLVANGALVNSPISKDSNLYRGCSPLYFAAESLQVEIVEFLLAHGADAKICGGFRKNTPLHLACQFKQLRRADDSEPVNEKEKDDQMDWLPSRSSQIRIVELLIEYGALVDAKNVSGSTPLMELFEIASILSDADDEERNTLEREIFTRQQKLMDILLHHGANINARNEVDGSILHIISQNFGACPLNKELAEMILKRGADVNITCEFQVYTPLHLAVSESVENKLDTSLIDLFIKYDANINAKSETLDTPLHLALEFPKNGQKREAILTTLLDHPNIDVNAQNCRKRTPLHTAIDYFNNYGIAKLLESGADINLEDADGNPASHDLINNLDAPDSLEDENNFKLLVSIVIHIKKLVKLKFHVSKKVMEDFEELSQFIAEESLTVIDNEINKEIEQLKTQRLDSYTSFYDILFKDPTAMSKHVQNKDLQATLVLIHLGWDYPLFGHIIGKQYEKGYNRAEVLGPAKKALDLVTNMSWPDVCSEKILSYLVDDNDLKILIQTLPHNETRKRPSNDLPQIEMPPAKTSRCNQ